MRSGCAILLRGCAILLSGCAILLSGCAAGPDYKKPDLALPAAWQTEPPWRTGTPDDAAFKGPWWLRFNDARLTALEEQALANSPSLDAATARLAQARASLAATAAAVLPQLGATVRPARQRISANRPLSNYNAPNFATVQNDLTVSMSVNYEVDLAGRVQRSVEGARASAEQLAADLENTRLLITSDLASAYFNLRAIDTEIDVLGRSIALQRRALDLVNARHDGGAATGLDVAQQQALLDTTLVQVDVLLRQRGQFEHAVATLAGVPAPGFALAADASELTAPPLALSLALGVPSDLLERRPDIAAAERSVAAANAQIGVAAAAFFPSITLGGSGGVESRALATLFNAPSVLWSLGATATQVLFDGGRLKANEQIARAGHAVTVANYRRVVLVAMQEVEDGITGLAALDRAWAQAGVAVATANRVLEMVTARYEGGAAVYFDVITAQQSLLTAQRQSAQLLGQRLLTSVFLVKALGGDWGGSGSRRGAAAAVTSGAAS